MGFPSHVITMLRARKEAFMTDTCDLLEPTHGVDEVGSPMLSYTTAASGVKCRVITAGTRNQPMVADYGHGETIVQRYRISLPWNTTVGTGWRVVYAGDTYEVASVSDALTDRDEVQCVLTRVQS